MPICGTGKCSRRMNGQKQNTKYAVIQKGDENSSVTLLFHQTWLAGKSSMDGGLIRKITHRWSIFQHAMFDDIGG